MFRDEFFEALFILISYSFDYVFVFFQGAFECSRFLEGIKAGIIIWEKPRLVKKSFLS